jgi:hypothetical protein
MVTKHVFTSNRESRDYLLRLRDAMIYASFANNLEAVRYLMFLMNTEHYRVFSEMAKNELGLSK